jgi:hypothetical protein
VRSQHRHLAADAKQRRRVVDHAQPRRIVRLAERNQRDAEPPRGFDLAFGGFDGADTYRLCGPAAPRQIGQSVKRGAGAAVVIDQRAEGSRTDVVAANEAQPIAPLVVRQLHAGLERL